MEQLCQYSDTGVIPKQQPYDVGTVRSFMESARRFLEQGEPGNALAIIKAIHGRTTHHPAGYEELQMQVRKAMGIPETSGLN